MTKDETCALFDRCAAACEARDLDATLACFAGNGVYHASVMIKPPDRLRTFPIA